MYQPNFSTVICGAFLNASVNGKFLKDLSKSLHLSTLEKITVGLALSDSVNFDLRIQGIFFAVQYLLHLLYYLKQIFCAFLDWYISTLQGKIFALLRLRNFSLTMMPLFLVRKSSVLMFLYNSQGFSKYVDSFTKMLSLVEQCKRNPCVLSPLLADIQSLRYIHITHSLFDKFAYILKCCCGNCLRTIGSVLWFLL